MAARSHTLVRGPITSRDWFSLRLQGGGGGGGGYLEGGQVTEPRAIAEGTGKPVEGIEHLYGDEHGEGHGHGVHVREDTAAVQVSKHLVVFCALEVVALRGGRGGGGGGGGGEERGLEKSSQRGRGWLPHLQPEPQQRGIPDISA